MADIILWDYLILSALKGEESMHLRKIYSLIDELMHGRPDNPDLKIHNPKLGNQPKYSQVVRSTLSKLKDQGLVEHLGKGHTGKYRLTEAGQRLLDEMKEKDKIFSNRTSRTSS